MVRDRSGLPPEALAAAERTGEAFDLLSAHYAVGESLFWQGHFSRALPHFEHSIKLYNPGAHGSLAYTVGFDRGVAAHGFAAQCHTFLGHPDRAGAVSEAAVALSEGLHRELALVESKIKASVLCPGFVHTRIMESERNRPAELPLLPVSEAEMQYAEMMRARVATGLGPTEVARQVFEAIRDERFYIVTDPDEWKPFIRERMEDILGDRNPRLMDFARG